jgi:lysophospholipase L1-like esterase
MKKFIIPALYNLVAVIILCLLFEAVIRLTFPEIRYGGGTSKELLVDSMYFSSPGLRADTQGESNSIIKATNSYHAWKYSGLPKVNKKILLLGDSVTMGIGVENDSTFAGLLANYYETINPSLIGYSSHDYLNLCTAYITENRYKINFDAVLVFWTLNDIYSNIPIEPPPSSFSPGDFLYTIINFLRRNSKAYFFIKNIVSDRSKVYFDYDRRYYDTDNELLINSVKDIVDLSIICKGSNIPLYLFIFPYEYQLRQIQDGTLLNPQKVLKNLLSQNGIEAIDCINAFEGKGDDSKKYYLFADGIHFSEKGHRLMAEFIKKKLQLLTLTPKPEKL